MTDLQALHDTTHTMVMGVLNITEDSSSDGGLWLDPAKAAQHGRDMMAAGVKPERIIIDPGLGFSKPGIEHNLPLLTGLETFRATGYPVLIGQSRKRFISAMLTEAGAAGADGPIMAQRDDVTAALSALSAEHGAWAVRVHDVAKSRAAVIAGNTWREYA